MAINKRKKTFDEISLSELERLEEEDSWPLYTQYLLDK
jgi:hypothetical protein